MTPTDEIISMAREAGFQQSRFDGKMYVSRYGRDIAVDAELTAFAALVAAHENEQCAKVFDRFDLSGLSAYPEIQKLVADTLIAARELIHDRSKP